MPDGMFYRLKPEINRTDSAKLLLLPRHISELRKQFISFIRAVAAEFPASYVALSPKVIKFLSPQMPSMHQLFPSRIDHQFNGGIIKEIGDVNGNGISDENYSFSQIVGKLDSDFPETTPGTVGAGFHDFAGQDNWQNDQSGIEYYPYCRQAKSV